MWKKPSALLGGLLSLLRALHWHYWTAHWKAKGPAAYGDHLLFQRLYEARTEEIDTLAEKIAGLFDESELDAIAQSTLMQTWLQRWSRHGDVFECSLAAERDAQGSLRMLRSALESTGHLTLGLDDYLTETASRHETASYLLKQRSKSSE